MLQGWTLACGQWRLVDIYNFVKILNSFYQVMLAGFTLALLSSAANRLYKISFIRELFPDPETPVMHVNTPKGILTFIF